ncbi:MAG: hypothetical protein U5M23_08710 [Marinagarivorans sp.]|nr:hypothetical protein [Marinagarivorans sp.]
MPRHEIPLFIADRKWWLLPLLVWTLIVGLSLINHRNDIDENVIETASSGAATCSSMVVLTRTWNARHGGVYAVTEKLKPNPALDHPRRDITTTDGQQLTMINPGLYDSITVRTGRVAKCLSPFTLPVSADSPRQQGG